MAEPISINGPAVAPPGGKTQDYREAHQVRIRAAAIHAALASGSSPRRGRCTSTNSGPTADHTDPPEVQKAMTRLDQIMESGRSLRADVPRELLRRIRFNSRPGTLNIQV